MLDHAGPCKDTTDHCQGLCNRDVQMLLVSMPVLYASPYIHYVNGVNADAITEISLLPSGGQ